MSAKQLVVVALGVVGALLCIVALAGASQALKLVEFAGIAFGAGLVVVAV